MNEDASTRSITLNITQYEGDFGIINIVPSTWLVHESGVALSAAGKARGYLLDPGLLTVHTLKAESATENENRGGGRRGYVEAILTLSVGSPLAHGKFDSA